MISGWGRGAERKQRRCIWLPLLLAALCAGASSPVFAAPTVEIWGHNECAPCIRLGVLLKQRKIPVQSHNLHLPEVEQAYVRRFGRGDIPVAVIGSTVIRGYKPEAVLAAVGSAGKSVRQSPQSTRGPDGREAPAPQLCASGIPLEEFFQQEAKDPFPPGRDHDEVLFDRCYGAKGRLLCPDGEVPFEALEDQGTEWRVKPTYQTEWLTKPHTCTVLRY